MNEEILINITPQETRVALIQQGAVQELQIERTRQRGIVGNIYLAKVARVLPGMQSAFIEIGLDRTAFMHVADILQNHSQTQIEKLLFEGQTLLVQVLKDPLGTKGARLTTQLSIAGRNLVYLPPNSNDPSTEKYIGISQRIEAPEERETIKNRLAGLMPADEKGGIIVRTSAQEATDNELQHDMHYLRTTWENILEAAKTKSAPSLLYQDLSLAERVLRDLAGEETTQIRVDSAENYEKLNTFASNYMPNVLGKLTLHRGERALFDLFDVDTEINKALGRRVDLKSGGYLMIDQTESMTTIDVNTGSYVGARKLDDTVFKTNLEAAQSIARQLRLRNLGGIIIIDFIDMLSKEHQESVLHELKRNLERDHARTSVNDFSSLGLVEMTRKRTRESLAHITCEPCPSCAGKGEVKTPQTICYEILREIVREHRQFNPREFRIVAAPDVIDLFLEEESQFLARLGDFVAKPIKLQAEASFRQEQYDIVLS
ncbi:ribonuclease G [Polynucleobacter paneuropaeus]|nr:ribonuclease G [Polynucleobacter paneuropaeus]QWD40511.1 ribonuclease G [Polynucleobacter paneuropaeus]